MNPHLPGRTDEQDGPLPFVLLATAAAFVVWLCVLFGYFSAG